MDKNEEKKRTASKEECKSNSKMKQKEESSKTIDENVNIFFNLVSQKNIIKKSSWIGFVSLSWTSCCEISPSCRPPSVFNSS